MKIRVIRGKKQKTMKNKILTPIYIALFLIGSGAVQASNIPNPLNNPNQNPIMPPPPSPANPPGDDEASIDFGLVYLLVAGAVTGIYLLPRNHKKRKFKNYKKPERVKL